MEIRMNIEKKDLDNLLKEAAKAWDKEEFREKDEIGKGYSFKFEDLDANNVEVNDSEMCIFATSESDKTPSLYVDLTYGYDSLILSRTVEYVTKSLNRFKSAMESLSAL